MVEGHDHSIYVDGHKAPSKYPSEGHREGHDHSIFVDGCSTLTKRPRTTAVENGKEDVEIV